MNHPEYCSVPTSEELAKAEAMAHVWYGVVIRYYLGKLPFDIRPLRWDELEAVSRADMINLFVYFNRELDCATPDGCDGVPPGLCLGDHSVHTQESGVTP